jgi:hypothetical protein
MGSRQSTEPLFEDFARDVRIALEAGKQQYLVILVIPSHDDNNRPIPDQNMWADAGSVAFADLYRGATAFRAHFGIFKTDEGTILRDEPILLESYANPEDVLDQAKLRALHGFAVRMGKATRQDTVAVVINNFMHFIPMKRSRGKAGESNADKAS